MLLLNEGGRSCYGGRKFCMVTASCSNAFTTSAKRRNKNAKPATKEGDEALTRNYNRQCIWLLQLGAGTCIAGKMKKVEKGKMKKDAGKRSSLMRSAGHAIRQGHVIPCANGKQKYARLHCLQNVPRRTRESLIQEFYNPNNTAC